MFRAVASPSRVGLASIENRKPLGLKPKLPWLEPGTTEHQLGHDAEATVCSVVISPRNDAKDKR